jgi:plastocyanin
MTMRKLWWTALAVGALAGCGSSNSGGGSCTPVSTTNIAISSTGVTPKAVCVLPGGTVKFNNDDTAAHDIESGASCPALNLGSIAAGANATATLPTSGTCNFHDELDPTNVAFQGTVAVTSATTSGPGY